MNRVTSRSAISSSAVSRSTATGGHSDSRGVSTVAGPTRATLALCEARPGVEAELGVGPQLVPVVPGACGEGRRVLDAPAETV